MLRHRAATQARLTCGKTNHIQWLCLRPALQFAHRLVVDAVPVLRLDEALEPERVAHL